MDNQHKMIKGYRDLSQEEIDIMNGLKRMAEMLGKTIHSMEETSNLDQRWISIGKTHAQQAFMALIRAVAKPTTF